MRQVVCLQRRCLGGYTVAMGHRNALWHAKYFAPIGVRRSLMLHKCANPACTAIFRYLREGKMFYVETEMFGTNDPDVERRRKGSRRLEHYWLCEECSSHVTLAFDKHKGLLTVPLPDGMGKKTIRMLAPERVLA